MGLNTSDYKEVLKALFPSGLAWKVDPGKSITALVEGFASELARYDASLNNLLSEINPGTAVDLLPDWENLFGCPWNGSDPVPVRQANVLARMTAVGDQSLGYFIRMAQQLGFNLNITEYEQAVAGSVAGCLCVNQYYKFTATFNLPVTPANTNNKQILQNIVLQNQPAHIAILLNWQ